MTQHTPPLEPMLPQMVVPLAYETEADHSWRRPVRVLLILSILYAAAAIMWEVLWVFAWFDQLMSPGPTLAHGLALAYVLATLGAAVSASIALVFAVLCLRGSDLRRPLCMLLLVSVACILLASIAQGFYLVVKYSVPTGYLNLAMAFLMVLCQGMFPLAVTLLLWPRPGDPLKELFHRARR